jgi:hypothetical protein
MSVKMVEVGVNVESAEEVIGRGALPKPCPRSCSPGVDGLDGIDWSNVHNQKPHQEESMLVKTRWRTQRG